MAVRQRDPQPPLPPGMGDALQRLLAMEGTGPADDDPLVYLGEIIEKVEIDPSLRRPGLLPGTEAPLAPPGIRGPKRTEEKKRDRMVPLSQALTDFHTWDPKTQKDFIAKAKIGGLMAADGGLIEASRLWEMLVREAAQYSERNVKMSPWDILTTYVKDSGGADAVWQRDPSNPDFEVNRLTGERRYIGPEFKTTTQTRTDFTDPATAAAIATSIFQQLMGRDPGPGELGQFATALQAAEAASPAVTTTQTQFDPATGEPIGSDTVTEGGLDAAGRQLLAEQQVKETEEYGVVQAATTYQGALESAVWGAPELGR